MSGPLDWVWYNKGMKVALVVFISLLPLILSFQNCSKNGATAFEPSSNSTVLDSIGQKEYILEDVFDGNQVRMEKERYAYHFLGKVSTPTIPGYPYALTIGPKSDCNTGGTYCRILDSGNIDCMSISTLMACTCEYDISNYYIIPSEFKVEFLNSEKSSIRITDVKNGTSAVLRAKKENETFQGVEPEEICNSNL